jgi:lysophospholipase
MDNETIAIKLKSLASNIKRLDLSGDVESTEFEREYFRYYGIAFEEKFPELKHSFGCVESAPHSIATHYYDLKDAEGTCFIVHGYYDHSGLYGRLIEYCLKRKLSVVIYDLPGHGLSSGERASISSFSEYQAVLSRVVELFTSVAPQPWNAIGQSTGGAIVMDFLLSAREPVFVNTVLLAPLLQPASWRRTILLHRLVSVFVNKLTRRFAKNSHDKSFLDFVKNGDPLQPRHLPLTWVTALKQWINYFEHLRFVDYAPLIIQGKEDETVDWKYNVPAIQKKFPNSKLYYLKDGRHHLANESEEILTNIYSAMDMYFDVFKH